MRGAPAIERAHTKHCLCVGFVTTLICVARMVAAYATLSLSFVHHGAALAAAVSSSSGIPLVRGSTLDDKEASKQKARSREIFRGFYYVHQSKAPRVSPQ